MVQQGHDKDPDYYGMVAACLIDPDGNASFALNHLADDEHRIHAERAAIEKYEKAHGDVPEGSTIITTLSPCSEHMHDREGKSCTDLLNDYGITKVYCGYIDPTQIDDCEEKRDFALQETKDQQIIDDCEQFADTFLRPHRNTAPQESTDSQTTPEPQ